MLKNEIEVNGRYVAKISGKTTIVKIVCAQSIGKGWSAINCSTGRRVQIRSAQKLHRAVSEDEWANFSKKEVCQPIESTQ